MDALADLASDHGNSIPGLAEAATNASSEASSEVQVEAEADDQMELSSQAEEPTAAEETATVEAQVQGIEQAQEPTEVSESSQAAAVEAQANTDDTVMQSDAAPPPGETSEAPEQPTVEPLAETAQQSGQDTQASLDSLLGSLVGSAPQEEAEGATASQPAQEAQPSDMSMPPFDDIAAALASAPTDAQTDIPGASASSAAPEASAPQVPADVTVAPDTSMQGAPEPPTQQDIKPFAHVQNENSRQATPNDNLHPKQQSQDTQPPPPSSYVQAVAPITSTGPSGTLTKTTPLASDPSIARQTAQQLLDRKPSTLSRLAKLRQRVEKDRFDGSAWLELIQDAVQKGDLEKTREMYNAFLRNFPDNAREWIAFADLELSHGNNERVNEIFGRCLRGSPSVALWHFYLTYIRRTNPIDRSSIERALPARDVITKAFEFSLAHVGADIEAGSIWHDYIEFLKEGEVAGTWEAQQKMDKLRQTYQRAVCIPLLNIEQIWRDYDAFENNLNRATAKKFLQDRSPAYMTARVASRQLQQFMDRMSRDPVPHQPNWNSSSDKNQIQVWKNLLSYEESDPMELGDPAAVRTRTMLAYKKAIAQLRFYPEIWYLAASYAKKVEKPDEATAFYKGGMDANPLSLLIHYAYIESEEGKGNFEECHRVYNALVERLQAEIETVNAATKTEINEALAEKARLEAQEKEARSQNMDDEDVIGEDVRIQERENIKKAIEDSRAGELEELKRLGANVWIMQMRFARRAEGIQAARSVFSRARKWVHTTWQVFEASAMLELHWNKEQKIATNVFEVGLKRFGDEIGFVVRYLDFLLAVNDDGNARAVFERTISKIPAEKAKPLWRRWADHEYLFGDLAAIQKLDARLAETYPDDPAINRFTERHTYLDLDDIAYRDLGQDDEVSRGAKREATTPPPQGYTRMPPQQQQQSSIPPYQHPPPQMMPPQQQQMGGSMPPQQQPPGFGGPPPAGPPGNQAVPPPFAAQGQPYPGPSGNNFDGGFRNSPSIDGDRRGGPQAGRNGALPPQQYAQQNKRRRSPSPPGRRGRRATSPNRVSRHTPPDDFPEAIPWLMAQLPSKTVFAAHGPILDWQHLLHLLMTSHIPLPNGQDLRGRDRSISPRRRMNGPPGGGAGRRRSPDYGRRR